MVDKTDVIYDDVRFIEPVSRTLAIANTGQVKLQKISPPGFTSWPKVPVSFEFIKKPGESSYARPWLQAEPSSGFIMPGERHNSIQEKMVTSEQHKRNTVQTNHYQVRSRMWVWRSMLTRRQLMHSTPGRTSCTTSWCSISWVARTSSSRSAGVTPDLALAAALMHLFSSLYLSESLAQDRCVDGKIERDILSCDVSGCIPRSWRNGKIARTDWWSQGAVPGS